MYLDFIHRELVQKAGHNRTFLAHEISYYKANFIIRSKNDFPCQFLLGTVYYLFLRLGLKRMFIRVILLLPNLLHYKKNTYPTNIELSLTTFLNKCYLPNL